MFNKFSEIYYHYPTFRYIMNRTVYEEEFPFNEKSKELLLVGGKKMLKYDKNKPTNFIPIKKENDWVCTSFCMFYNYFSLYFNAAYLF